LKACALAGKGGKEAGPIFHRQKYTMLYNTIILPHKVSVMHPGLVERKPQTCQSTMLASLTWGPLVTEEQTQGVTLRRNEERSHRKRPSVPFLCRTEGNPPSPDRLQRRSGGFRNERVGAHRMQNSESQYLYPPAARLGADGVTVRPVGTYIETVQCVLWGGGG